MTEFSRLAPDHRWHLGLTIVTLGLWGIAWLAVVLAGMRYPWRCSTCQSPYVPVAKRNGGSVTGPS